MRRISHTYLIHVFTVIFRNILLFDIDKLVYDMWQIPRCNHHSSLASGNTITFSTT